MELFPCPGCHLGYNAGLRKPIILPCGDTICSTCISGTEPNAISRICVECSASYSSIDINKPPINYILLNSDNYIDIDAEEIEKCQVRNNVEYLNSQIAIYKRISTYHENQIEFLASFLSLLEKHGRRKSSDNVKNNKNVENENNKKLPKRSFHKRRKSFSNLRSLKNTAKFSGPKSAEVTDYNLYNEENNNNVFNFKSVKCKKDDINFNFEETTRNDISSDFSEDDFEFALMMLEYDSLRTTKVFYEIHNKEFRSSCLTFENEMCHIYRFQNDPNSQNHIMNIQHINTLIENHPVLLFMDIMKNKDELGRIYIQLTNSSLSQATKLKFTEQLTDDSYIGTHLICEISDPDTMTEMDLNYLFTDNYEGPEEIPEEKKISRLYIGYTHNSPVRSGFERAHLALKCEPMTEGLVYYNPTGVLNIVIRETRDVFHGYPIGKVISGLDLLQKDLDENKVELLIKKTGIAFDL